MRVANSSKDGKLTKNNTDREFQDEFTIINIHCRYPYFCQPQHVKLQRLIPSVSGVSRAVFTESLQEF